VSKSYDERFPTPVHLIIRDASRLGCDSLAGVSLAAWSVAARFRRKPACACTCAMAVAIPARIPLEAPEACCDPAPDRSREAHSASKKRLA